MLTQLHVNVCVLARDRCFVDWSISCRDDEVIIHSVDGRADDRRYPVSVLAARIPEPASVQWQGVTPQVAKFLAEQRP